MDKIQNTKLTILVDFIEEYLNENHIRLHSIELIDGDKLYSLNTKTR